MTETRRTLYPIVVYSDANAAIEFLIRAFGFVEHEIHRDVEGRVVHAELRYDTGILMPGQAGVNTATEVVPTSIYVAVDDTDAHHDRAVAAGARVVRELMGHVVRFPRLRSARPRRQHLVLRHLPPLRPAA